LGKEYGFTMANATRLKSARDLDARGQKCEDRIPRMNRGIAMPLSR
jgi:hypothetical protein